MTHWVARQRVTHGCDPERTSRGSWLVYYWGYDELMLLFVKAMQVLWLNSRQYSNT